MRGPESSLITWSPYKVIIRVLKLVLLYVSVSIGWHHCRTQDEIGPRNWSTVMWPIPIGWWRRVSPAIYTTRAQDLGSVCCLVLWELVRAWGSTPPSAGSTVHHRQQPLLRDSPPVERARPLYIPYRVPPWSQPNPARRSGAPGDTRYLCVVYKELVMYSWINVLLKLTLELCSSLSATGISKTPDLVTSLEPVPRLYRCTGGNHSGESWGRRCKHYKNIHNEKASRP